MTDSPRALDPVGPGLVPGRGSNSDSGGGQAPALPRALDPAERQDLIRWITGLFTGPLLSPSGFPISQVGRADRGDLFPELADYAPLLAAAGAEDFGLGQGDLAFRKLSAEPLQSGLRTRFQHAGWKARLLQRLGAVHLQDYAEVLLAFVQLHEVTGKPEPLSWARWLQSFLFQRFGTRRGLASFWLHGRIPLYEPLSGILIEVALDCSRLSGDDEARGRALAAIQPFLESPVFEAFGLWPSFVAGSPRSRSLPIPAAGRIDLAKANTAMASALVAAFASTRQEQYASALRHFVRKGLAGMQARGGGICNLAHIKGSSVEPLGPPSSANHAVIELLLDAHRTLGDAAMLEAAVRLAAFWSAQIHPMTGLMPDLANGRESFVDGNTDFAVVYRKLHDLTGDRAFLSASEALVAGVARWHRTPHGLARRTVVATGAISDGAIETRYTSLYLKPLLISEGSDVWSSAQLLSLLRDR